MPARTFDPAESLFRLAEAEDVVDPPEGLVPPGAVVAANTAVLVIVDCDVPEGPVIVVTNTEVAVEGVTGLLTVTNVPFAIVVGVKLPLADVVLVT